MVTERETHPAFHRPPFRAAPSTPPGEAAQAVRRRADRTVLIPSPGRPSVGGGIGDVPKAPDLAAFHPRSLPPHSANSASLPSGVALFVGGVR